MYLYDETEIIKCLKENNEQKIVTNIFLTIFANRSKSKYINTWNKNIIIQV